MRNPIIITLLLLFVGLAVKAQELNVDGVNFKPTDFSGLWAGGLKITVTGKSVSIDMSKQNRKNATGTIIDNKTIRVNFPGDKEYTGTLVSLNRINWGGNNNWDRDTPVFEPTDFNGLWAGGLKITITGKSVSIDMSKQNRENATGTVIDNKTIRVNFPGDKEYTGTLVSLNRINWGGNNNWDRDTPIFRPTDFNGLWAGGLKITVTGKSVSIDMSKLNRKNATGTVVDNKTIRVDFPGDKEYTGTLVSLNRINWGGDNNWDRDK